MKRLRLAVLIVLSLLVATSVNAQTTFPVGTSVPPVGEVCIVPNAPEINMTAMSNDASPINVWAVLYKVTPEGNIYMNQSSCATSESQGCFNNGHGKFTTDEAGNKLTVGDYMIMAYPQLEGYDGTVIEFHAEAGSTSVNLILRQQTVSITMYKSSSKRGQVNYEFSIAGDLPAGTDIYTIVWATGPTGAGVSWEANRKTLSGGDYSSQVLMKQSFFAEGAPTGFQICGTVYLAQRGAPTRPLAQNQFCVANEK
jgi:hypothetical protein